MSETKHAYQCPICRYQRRGLALDADCPECGATAPDEHDGNMLAGAPLPYLKRLRLGVIALKVIGLIAVVGLLTPLDPAHGDHPARAGSHVAAPWLWVWMFERFR